MNSEPKDQLNEENIISQLDVNKEFFSLQEVVELTLLHAQQVHVLQKYYEYVFY